MSTTIFSPKKTEISTANIIRKPWAVQTTSEAVLNEKETRYENFDN